MHHFQELAFDSMPSSFSAYEEGTEALNDEEESPVMTCLRLRNQASSVSSSCNSSLAGFSDSDSLCPIDAFDDDDDLFTGKDTHLVDFALRISQDSISNDFHDSASSGISIGDTSLFDDATVEEDQKNGVPMAAPVYQDPMASLNESIASLNDAFEKLTACMERTAQTRTMLKQYSTNPEEQTSTACRESSQRGSGLSRQSSNRSLNGLGSSSQGRRRMLSRSGSNTSLNSLGSSRSLGSGKSLGSGVKKSKSKTSRKLRRSVKSDLTRGGLIRRPMPQIVMHTSK